MLTGNGDGGDVAYNTAWDIDEKPGNGDGFDVLLEVVVLW